MRPASVIGRLLGDFGVAHPMQGHLSQERRYPPLSFAGQHLPNRRRQIAHRGIQANAPGRIALQSRFSAIRRVPSIYERYREWDIEPSFRDSKDLRFGMGMSRLRIDDPQRRDRLLLLNAFAIMLLTLLGAAGESLGMDRQLRTSTAKRRVHSLFRQGCLLYELIPNMPDERLRPLIERYQQLLRENRVFSDAFGII
jgi:hypothetical protein